MPKTPKTPPLSDWRVQFSDPGSAGRPAVTVRATSLRTPPGWVFLDDADGNHLLAVREERVAYVKRLEPGGEGEPAAPQEAAPADPPLPRRRRGDGTFA